MEVFQTKDEVVGVTMTYEGKLVHREHTPYQLIEIFDTPKLGRILKLNDDIQLSTFDEKAYHTNLVNKKFIDNERIQTVLVIGGGDGGTIRELCQTNVKKIVMVEIDAAVIEACKKYLPTLSNGAFDDPRVEVIIGDAFDYIRNTDMQYDLVISDLPDMEPDFETMAKAVSEGGYFICQQGTGLSEFNMEELIRRKTILHNLYKSADFFGVRIPSFAYGDTVFSFSRK